MTPGIQAEMFPQSGDSVKAFGVCDTWSGGWVSARESIGPRSVSASEPGPESLLSQRTPGVLSEAVW